MARIGGNIGGTVGSTAGSIGGAGGSLLTTFPHHLVDHETFILVSAEAGPVLAAILAVQSEVRRAV